MIELVPNFVDLDRFARRPALPERPSRALIFCNDTGEGSEADIVRQACRSRGITLDIAGASAANVLVKPEEALPQYDLIFARGRSAIEALAVGASVVLFAVTRHGSLVARHNVDDLYRSNFGLRAVTLPLSVESIGAEIDKYDAQDSAALTDYIRDIADSRKALDRLESIYQRVLATTLPAADEERAVAGYLRWLSLSIKGKIVGLTYAPSLLKQIAALSLERIQLVSRLAELRSHQTNLETELRVKSVELERERLSHDSGENDREQELQEERRLRQWREEELLTIRRSRTFRLRDKVSSMSLLMRLYRALRR